MRLSRHSKQWFYELAVLLFTAGILAATPQPGPQPAGNDLKKLSLEELMQIEVTTPSKQPVRAFNTPAAIFVITGEDIRRSGVTSIPEALRLAPGVEVARIDANKWSVGIRGFGSRLTRSVLVLIDGRTVFTTLFAGTYWETQDTMMEDIDRIEVIRGPGGTIWGPNAVNGVINIITKTARDTRGTLVSTGGGNEDQGFVNARYGGGDGKGLDYRVYAKGFTRAPDYHSDGRNFDDWRSMQAGFRADLDRDNGTKLTLQGDIYTEVAGESVDATRYETTSRATIDDNAFLSGGNIMFRWTKKISDHSDIQVQAYFDRANRREPNIVDLRDTWDADFLQHIRVGKRQNISWGLGARLNPIQNVQAVSGLTFSPATRQDFLLTGFLQDEISLVPDQLSFTMGTKVVRTDFTKGYSLEPSARLAWTPDKNHTVWAAFTHALRTPSDVEENFALSGYISTAANGTPFFARFDPNPNFAPEQMNGYELGYRQLVQSKVLVSTSSFYNHYHDLFSEDFNGSVFFENTPAPPHLLLPAQFRNGLLATTKGIEGAAEWQPTAFWSLRGSYSFLHMNVYNAPKSGDIGTAAGIVGSSPEHQTTLISKFDLPHSVQLDLDARYVAALPGQNVPAYWTADARLGWRFNRNLELSVVGRNLLQPSHLEDGGDPGATPGTVVLVGVRRSGFLRLTWIR